MPAENIFSLFEKQFPACKALGLQFDKLMQLGGGKHNNVTLWNFLIFSHCRSAMNCSTTVSFDGSSVCSNGSSSAR